jgi:Family of unknown function (DUF5330)
MKALRSEPVTWSAATVPMIGSSLSSTISGQLLQPKSRPVLRRRRIASISDIRQFCGRQPDACATGSQAIGQFGDKAQTGAKLLYRLLHEQASTVPVKGGDKPSTGDPSLSTLTPADLAIPWHEPRPRVESRAQRSSRGLPPVRAADEDGGDGKDRTSNSNVLMVRAAPLSQ